MLAVADTLLASGDTGSACARPRGAFAMARFQEYSPDATPFENKPLASQIMSSIFNAQQEIFRYGAKNTRLFPCVSAL